MFTRSSPSLLVAVLVGVGGWNVTAAEKPVALADFEQSEVGKVPAGWFVPMPTVNAGFRAEVSETHPMQGKRCAVLFSGDKPGFGNLMTNVNAKDFRGKQVRIKAAIKSEVAKQAPLLFWVRVDRANGETGYFDNMADRPITKKDWHYYDHQADIAANAETIAIGLLFNGAGKAWIDDVTIEVLGPAGSGAQPPAPLTPQGLNNVIAFGRLVGYVRFFHPSDEAAKTKWGRFVIDYVGQAESAKNPAELVQQLNAIFQPIAPGVRAFSSNEPPPPVPTPAEGLKNFVYWRHDGVNLGQPQSIYASKRIANSPGLFGIAAKLPKDLSPPNPLQPLVVDLGSGVSASIPLAVFTDDKGTLPRPNATTPPPGKPATFAPTGNDRATRLADVILAWTVFQHFYPYFDVVKSDWDAELKNALHRAATDTDEKAFVVTLRRMVAALKDGHGFVSSRDGNRSGGAFPPIRWDWIENQLVITDVEKKHRNQIEPGDVVVSIDGEPTTQALAKVEEMLSGATPQFIRHNALRELATGPHLSKLKLALQRGTEKKEVEVVRWHDLATFFMDRHSNLPKKIAEVRPGIWYVDLDRITDANFAEAVPQLEKAKGIIFDLRGYPSSVGTNPIGHITGETLTCAQWHIPLVLYPDRKDMQFSFSNWKVPPRKPRFNAKVAFITDGRAISYAETYLGIIEHYKLADIVGGPTAGTNGNVNPFTLPGGYGISWTGMRVLKHDGKTHHGVGIQPTVPVQRTIAGVKAGADELLEKAIVVVGGQSQ